MATIGSICTGYGGLDMAVSEIFGATTEWASEIDPGASRIIARHWPDMPNLGDISAVDWAAVEPVDIIAGGTPCQDVSLAGARAGMTADTRSGLWEHMRRALATIQPSVVVWENVPGATSAAAASRGDHDITTGHLGSGAGPVGHGSGRPALRALGRVLGDLATLGFDAQWTSLRASDVGACHLRSRIFVLAWRRNAAHTDCGPASAESLTFPRGEVAPRTGRRGESVADTDRRHSDRGRPASRPTGGPRPASGRRGGAPLAVLPTPTSSMPPWHNWGTRRMDGLPRIVTTLPTPRAGDGAAGGPTTDIWGETPYLAAILRHEQALGRVAPHPTEPTQRGGQRLSPRFVEWMMMLPDGWVTGTPGLTRSAQLKALGNGVVPPQAIEALRRMAVHLPRAEGPAT